MKKGAIITGKKIENIGKVCTSKRCESKCFPYYAEGCIITKLVVEYKGVK